jgi:glycosyltransferase involved in cell wall biosynthesis
VALDLRLLDDPALAERGIGRYARELAAALREEGADVAELRHLRRPPSPRRIAELWEHVLLGRDARRAGAEVLHSPAIDMVTRRPGIAYVVTLHDLVPLKRPEDYLRTGLKHRLRYAAASRATRVIVPTRAVADDAARLLGLERVDVVHEAPAPAFEPVAAPQGLLERLRVPDRFVLWVGGLDPPDPRKGVEALARAVAADGELPLVLAGRHDERGAALAVEGRVVLTGRVDDEELAALYSAAQALVLPSLDEGFGLTAHEALACGTPVVAYRVPALAETLESNPAVRLVPRGDVAALLAATGEIAGMEAVPPARTWADVARETLAVYERALSDRGAGAPARP